MKTINTQEIKEIIQSSNLNFLIGAGLSAPFLPILNDIEKRLVGAKNQAEKILIYKEYFSGVMLPNLKIINKGNGLSAPEQEVFNIVYQEYKKFFELMSSILLRRKSTILSKQVNIFTTNIDAFMETALEACNIEYNDGFSGHLDPVFSLSNFKKSIYKRSLHFENVSEIPVFNLLKMHGSLTWKKGLDDNNEKISFSKLEQVEKVQQEIDATSFITEYEKLPIINPEKIKFEETVIQLTYYELLRMYSSELEKENTVLFVMGFSMADEHIKEITIRCANSNPTLKIYIFCYSSSGAIDMRQRIVTEEIKYKNIEIIEPIDGEAINCIDLKKINSEIFMEIIAKEQSNQETNE